MVIQLGGKSHRLAVYENLAEMVKWNKKWPPPFSLLLLFLEFSVAVKENPDGKEMYICMICIYIPINK